MQYSGLILLIAGLTSSTSQQESCDLNSAPGESEGSCSSSSSSSPAAMTSSLTVIDYSEKDRAKQARKIVSIMEDLGFLFLENIPGYDEDDLRWCVDFFFGLPEEKKKQVARKLWNPESKQVNSYTSVLFDS